MPGTPVLSREPAASASRDADAPVHPQADARPGPAAAISTAAPQATAIGAAVLADGGNAVDAAVAAAWALAVCEPSGSGLGGQAVMLVSPVRGPALVLDGHARAPRSASPALIGPHDQRYGPRATTVPTMAAVLSAAHTRWGQLPWERVVAPAADLAEDGHLVGRLEAVQLGWVADVLRRDPATAAVFLPRGTPAQPGERLRQPALAATLRRIAVAGAEDFYRGALARSVVADQQARSGLITLEDLRRAEHVQLVPPLLSRHGDRVVATAPPPSGGLALALALRLLELNRPETGWEHGPWLLAIARAVRAAHAVRDRLGPEADPDAVLSAPDLKALVPLAAVAGRPGPEPPGETTHLSVCDATGTTVALTSSVQSLYGAKVINARLGFLYNNYLVTCPRRSGPYRLGPECRPRSNAAPTTVTDPHGGALVLGAAGSRRITSSLVHLISATADRGVPLADAMRAPRVHGLDSGRIWVERPAAAELRAALAAEPSTGDRQPVQVKGGHDYAMAGAHAVQRDRTGLVVAVADPRRDGTVRCVPRPERG